MVYISPSGPKRGGTRAKLAQRGGTCLGDFLYKLVPLLLSAVDSAEVALSSRRRVMSTGPPGGHVRPAAINSSIFLANGFVAYCAVDDPSATLPKRVGTGIFRQIYSIKCLSRACTPAKCPCRKVKQHKLSGYSLLMDIPACWATLGWRERKQALTDLGEQARMARLGICALDEQIAQASAQVREEIEVELNRLRARMLMHWWQTGHRHNAGLGPRQARALCPGTHPQGEGKFLRGGRTKAERVATQFFSRVLNLSDRAS